MALSYAFDARTETPETVAARRKTADLLAARIFGRTPQNLGEGIGAIGQALIASKMAGDASAAQAAGAASGNDAYSQIVGAMTGQPAAVAPVSAAPMGSLSGMGPPVTPIAPSVSGKIYTNDEPSPLDPISGKDRDLAIRTVYGEDPGASASGVANVIRNRTIAGKFGGDTVSGVVMAKNQFEPWNRDDARARMMALEPNSAEYKRLGAIVDQAWAGGNDPTNGATHFFAPKAQAALGRDIPAWGRSGGQDIGVHRFFGGAPAQATQVAAAPTPVMDDGTMLPANAEPAQGGSPVAPRSSGPSMQMLMQAANNPWLNDSQKAVVQGMIKQKLEEQQKASDPLRQLQIRKAEQELIPYGDAYKDADGNLIQRDASGKITVLNAADKAPTSVSEYEYYKRTLPADKKPMDYDTWATAKARAAATTINNSPNFGGGSDKQIFDNFSDNTKEARATAAGLTALREARQAIQGPGGAVTGFGADQQLTLRKLGAAFGVSDPSKIQNTETFRAAIAPQVAAVMKNTVGTTNISNSDREFAAQAAGGSITLDAGTINRLLDIMERASLGRLQLHQEQLDAVYPDAEKHKRERALFGVKIPDAAAMTQVDDLLKKYGGK